MKNKQINIRNLLILAVLSFVVLTCVSCIRAYQEYKWYNLVLFTIVTVLTLINLFTMNRHWIAAIIWTVLMPFLLNPFFGSIVILLYWWMIFQKSKKASSANTMSKPNKERNIRYFKANDFEILEELQPIMHIPFVNIPAFWHKMYIVKREKTYLLINCPLFNFIHVPTDMCSLHRPDLHHEWTQLLNWGMISILTDEHPQKPIRILVSGNCGLSIISKILDWITEACEANNVKRVVGETTPHSKGKKNKKWRTPSTMNLFHGAWFLLITYKRSLKKHVLLAS